MDEQIENIMAQVRVLCTKRVRRFACNLPSYSGCETYEQLTTSIEKLEAELRSSLKALKGTSC